MVTRKFGTGVRLGFVGSCLLAPTLFGCTSKETSEEPVARQSEALVTTQRLGIPVYAADWSPAIMGQIETGGGGAIIMPGPVHDRQTQYANNIFMAHMLGIKVYGYVYSCWANTVSNDHCPNSLSNVLTNVDEFAMYYPEVDGIFVDEVYSNTGDCSQVGSGSFYETIRNQIKMWNPNWQVVFNPGTAVPSCYLNLADIIVTFESGSSHYQQHAASEQDWLNQPDRSWETADNSSHIWHIVNSDSDWATCAYMVGNTLLSRERNASLVYSTNAVGANYDFVSNNIDAQASLIQSLNAPVPDYASVAAFAWEPATMSGMMGGSYSWNSSGAENMVQHDMNTGVYTVTFPNLASLPIGVAHVSAYNGNHHCMVDSINASGADIQVVVRCFNTAGATGDGAFTIAYVSRQGQTGEESAYMTSQLPSNECTPALYGRSWASHGGSAVAWRIPGWSPSPNDGYEVYFPKQKSFQNNPRMFGTFEVTGFGSSNQYCTGLQFYDSQRSVAVDVACWNPGGNVADAPFSVTFAQGSPNGTPSYLWLRSEDVNSPYFPTPNYAGNQYGWNADHPLGQSAITTLLGTGQYKVDIPELRPWSASNAIVTAYGYSGSYCNVGWWTSSSMFSGGSEVRVNCYNASGALQNVTFQLVYSTN